MVRINDLMLFDTRHAICKKSLHLYSLWFKLLANMFAKHMHRIFYFLSIRCFEAFLRFALETRLKVVFESVLGVEVLQEDPVVVLLRVGLSRVL